MTASTRATGGDLVAAALDVLGVRHVFAVASIHNLPILGALHRLGATSVINVRDERAAVHAADAYARVTGELGVAVASTGPGTANAVGGLFEAHFASSRVMLLTGQVETWNLDRGWSALHEADRQLDMLRTLTRETLRVRRAGDAAEVVLRAAREALTGRPRPVAVEVPIDLQQAVTTRSCPEPLPVPRDPVDDSAAAEAAARLTAAERPIVWAGGGVPSAGAGQALAALAERLSLPVVTSIEGRGALPEDHPLCLGRLATVPPLRDFVESADVMLAVGTRFQLYPTDFWRLRMPGTLIHLDVDPGSMNRAYPSSMRLVGDADLGLRQILGHAADAVDRTAYLEEGRKARQEALAQVTSQMGPDHAAICDAIRRHLPREAVVVRDATVPAYVWADRVLPIVSPRTSIRPVASGIGPGLPFAIGAAQGGAALGRSAPTVLIQGDGGLMLSLGELATLAQYRLPVIVCIFNDGGYGVLRTLLAERSAPQHDVDLHTPRFAELAAAFDIPGTTVRTAADFERVFGTAVERGGPALIEIDMTALTPLRLSS